MITVTLNAESGGFVAHVKILPFQTAPAVVVWGDRFFLNANAKDDDGHPIYAEAFAVFTIPQFSDSPVRSPGDRPISMF